MVCPFCLSHICTLTTKTILSIPYSHRTMSPYGSETNFRGTIPRTASFSEIHGIAVQQDASFRTQRLHGILQQYHGNTGTESRCRMKKSFVPINKQSKKARKAYHSAQRSTWGILNPATRTMPNGKAYDRKKQKVNDRSDRESSFDSLPLPFCPSLLINPTGSKNILS